MAPSRLDPTRRLERLEEDIGARRLQALTVVAGQRAELLSDLEKNRASVRLVASAAIDAGASVADVAFALGMPRQGLHRLLGGTEH
jgi:hypothetical protein